MRRRSRLVEVPEFDSQLCSPTGQPFDDNCIPQPEPGFDLSAFQGYTMWRLQYRNFGQYETLVGNFVTDMTDEPGHDVPGDYAGIRWFELRKSGANDWDAYQTGAHSPDTTNRWLGSIAMDGAGNIALGYNVSSTTVSPGIRYTGRRATEPLHTMTGDYLLVSGSAPLTGSTKRWGDYAAMAVDPVDDKTFWFTGEYVKEEEGVGVWRTRIGTFSFTEPGPRVIGVKIGASSGIHADYSVPSGSGEQLRTVPVGPANEIMITFDEAVTIQKSNLTVTGAYTETTYDVAASAFSFDGGTNTAKWTFTTAFPADQIVLTLDDAVSDLEGNSLDGEWTNPNSLTSTGTDVFPSGNGVAGVDFVFRFTILPGDANRDNVIDLNDLNIVNNNYGHSPATWSMGEMTGDNIVNLYDKNLVQNNFGLNFVSWPSGGGEMAASGGAGPIGIEAMRLALQDYYVERVATPKSDGPYDDLLGWKELGSDDWWNELLGDDWESSL